MRIDTTDMMGEAQGLLEMLLKEYGEEKTFQIINSEILKLSRVKFAIVMTLLKDGFQPLTCKEITERLNKRGVKTSMSIVFRLLEKMTKAKALFKNDVRYSISQSPKAVVEFLAGKEKARTLDDTQSQRIISSITEALFKLEKEAKLVCWNELLDDEEDEVEQ